jgi:hypothetical protein
MLTRRASIAVALICSVNACANAAGYRVTVRGIPGKSSLTNASLEQMLQQMSPEQSVESRRKEIIQLRKQVDARAMNPVETYDVFVNSNATEFHVRTVSGKDIGESPKLFRDGLIFHGFKGSSQTGIIYAQSERLGLEALHFQDAYVATYMLDGTSVRRREFEDVVQKDGRYRLEFHGSGQGATAERRFTTDGMDRVLVRYHCILKKSDRVVVDYHVTNAYGSPERKLGQIVAERVPGAREPKIPFEVGKYVADRRAVPDGGAVKMIRWTGELPPLERPLLHPNVLRIGIPVALIGFGIALFFWRQRKR